MQKQRIFSVGVFSLSCVQLMLCCFGVNFSPVFLFFFSPEMPLYNSPDAVSPIIFRRIFFLRKKPLVPPIVVYDFYLLAVCNNTESLFIFLSFPFFLSKFFFSTISTYLIIQTMIIIFLIISYNRVTQML